jgi:hypothetical protein
MVTEIQTTRIAVILTLCCIVSIFIFGGEAETRTREGPFEPMPRFQRGAVAAVPPLHNLAEDVWSRTSRAPLRGTPD